MNLYWISAAIASVMVFSLYLLSLQIYPIALGFDLANHLATYKPKRNPVKNQLASLTMSVRSKVSLGGLCLFSVGGHIFDLRVQNAKVVFLVKADQPRSVKVTMASKAALYRTWNSLSMTISFTSSGLDIYLAVNGEVITAKVPDVPIFPDTPNEVTFGHLNFKGCLKDIYFNHNVVHEGSLVLINVYKGC